MVIHPRNKRWETRKPRLGRLPNFRLYCEVPDGRNRAQRLGVTVVHHWFFIHSSPNPRTFIPTPFLIKSYLHSQSEHLGLLITVSKVHDVAAVIGELANVGAADHPAPCVTCLLKFCFYAEMISHKTMSCERAFRRVCYIVHCGDSRGYCHTRRTAESLQNRETTWFHEIQHMEILQERGYTLQSQISFNDSHQVSNRHCIWWGWDQDHPRVHNLEFFLSMSLSVPYITRAYRRFLFLSICLRFWVKRNRAEVTIKFSHSGNTTSSPLSLIPSIRAVSEKISSDRF